MAPGRVFPSFGADLESVLLAVLTFLSAGVLMFITCFLVTKALQCYKSHLRKKRRRARGEDDDDFSTCVLNGTLDFDEEHEEVNETVETTPP